MADQGQASVTSTLQPFTKGHDAVVVIHTPPHGWKSVGYWVECECGWTSPPRETEPEASDLHRNHVNNTSQKD